MAWFSKKKVAPSTPILPPRFNAFNAHMFEERRLPDPGTQNYAYVNLGLFEQTFIGPGVANRDFLHPLQPPQLYQLQAVSTAGIGGLSAGQMVLQPLIDPNTEGLPLL